VQETFEREHELRPADDRAAAGDVVQCQLARAVRAPVLARVRGQDQGELVRGAQPVEVAHQVDDRTFFV
jgi:hypothetical protein